MNTLLNNYSSSLSSSNDKILIPTAVRIALEDLYLKQKPIEINRQRYSDLIKEREIKI